LINLVDELSKRRGVTGKLPTCSVPLTSITKNDLFTMPGGLLYLPKNEVSEEGAVEGFLDRYKAMKELEGVYPECRDMLTNFCSRIIAGE
jgi:hypothetical protein